MGKMKEFYHDDIEDGFRKEMVEEPERLPENEYNFTISVSTSRLKEIHTLLFLAYQGIKEGHLEDGETFTDSNGKISSYGFRKV